MREAHNFAVREADYLAVRKAHNLAVREADNFAVRVSALFSAAVRRHFAARASGLFRFRETHSPAAILLSALMYALIDEPMMSVETPLPE